MISWLLQPGENKSIRCIWLLSPLQHKSSPPPRAPLHTLSIVSLTFTSRSLYCLLYGQVIGGGKLTVKHSPSDVRVNLWCESRGAVGIDGRFRREDLNQPSIGCEMERAVEHQHARRLLLCVAMVTHPGSESCSTHQLCLLVFQLHLLAVMSEKPDCPKLHTWSQTRNLDKIKIWTFFRKSTWIPNITVVTSTKDLLISLICRGRYSICISTCTSRQIVHWGYSCGSYSRIITCPSWCNLNRCITFRVGEICVWKRLFIVLVLWVSRLFDY